MMQYNLIVWSIVFFLFPVGFKKSIHEQKVKETVFNYCVQLSSVHDQKIDFSIISMFPMSYIMDSTKRKDFHEKECTPRSIPSNRPISRKSHPKCIFNSFHATSPFVYPLRTSESLWCSDVFRGIPAWNRLMYKILKSPRTLCY